MDYSFGTASTIDAGSALSQKTLLLLLLPAPDKEEPDKVVLEKPFGSLLPAVLNLGKKKMIMVAILLTLKNELRNPLIVATITVEDELDDNNSNINQNKTKRKCE